MDMDSDQRSYSSRFAGMAEGRVLRPKNERLSEVRERFNYTIEDMERTLSINQPPAKIHDETPDQRSSNLLHTIAKLVGAPVDIFRRQFTDNDTDQADANMLAALILSIRESDEISLREKNCTLNVDEEGFPYYMNNKHKVRYVEIEPEAIFQVAEEIYAYIDDGGDIQMLLAAYWSFI
jgi:hypothetical protein